MRTNYSTVFTLGVSFTTIFASVIGETLFGSAVVLALLRQTIFYCRHKVKKLTDEAPTYEWHVAIETLDFVKPASVVVKYMHDNAAVVDQYPLLLRHTFA